MFFEAQNERRSVMITLMRAIYWYTVTGVKDTRENAVYTDTVSWGSVSTVVH